jgi:hypothetical protein
MGQRRRLKRGKPLTAASGHKMPWQATRTEDVSNKPPIYASQPFTAEFEREMVRNLPLQQDCPCLVPAAAGLGFP